MVMLSFVFFACAPKFTEVIRERNPTATVAVNITMSVVVCLCYLAINWVTFVLISFLFVLLLLILPWVYVKMQSMKNTIHGPWDEAVLKLD